MAARRFEPVDPAVLEAALRRFIALDVDYDFHKNYECGEEDGEDTYPELAEALAEHLENAAREHGYEVGS